MKLKLATDEDSDKILEFYAKTNLKGEAEIRLRRMYSFFNHYATQSHDYVTYLLLDEKENILAMASLLFYEAYLLGEKQMVCYATDLRISKSRKAIMHWAKHFLPLIQTETKKRNCKYVFSIVAKTQRQAYNALIRPRHLKRAMPRYHLFRKFQMVNIHGLWPFHIKPLDGIKVRPASRHDAEDIANYLSKRNAERPFHRVGEFDDFRKIVDEWPSLNMDNFIVARDYKEEVIGCCALWSAREVQRYFVMDYTATGENFRHALMWLSPFSKINKMPPKNSELKPRFMCFLQVDNPDVHHSLIYHAFQSIQKDEFLSYIHFDGELATLPPKGFISTEQKYTLFCVLQPGQELPDFLKPTMYSPGPAFEPVWL